MTILNLFLRGGILMYVLVLISIAVVAIVIQKYRHLAQVRRTNAKLRSSLLQTDSPDQIREVLLNQGKTSMLGLMLDKLYNAETKELDLIQSSMESTANMELHKLEKGMGWLSTFAAVAPLIGFLGTVTGMVRVFMNIQGQGQNSVDINILAGGIWEALLTTIGGLIVGIVAIVFYNDIVQNMENVAKEMQNYEIENVIMFRKTQPQEFHQQ